MRLWLAPCSRLLQEDAGGGEGAAEDCEQEEAGLLRQEVLHSGGSGRGEGEGGVRRAARAGAGRLRRAGRQGEGRALVAAPQ